MNNFFDRLKTILEQDTRFISNEGDLLRNRIYEAAMTMDAGLLALLLNNAETRQRFFTDVNGNLVFDKIAFGWVVNNRSFLPDSYTRFMNKIGLMEANGELLSTNEDVVLSFPHKDCLLEGGQTKEDQKRSEVFYNESLAPDEVDRLLYPKVLVHAERFEYEGDFDTSGLPIINDNSRVVATKVNTFKDGDNLILKGNNLLGLTSVLKRFAGKVKAIFIDPPYYFSDTKPSDSFSYNSNFKLSSWLVFMQNRLKIAHELLEAGGTIFISISDEGAHYLKVMADDVFKSNNFIADVTWESRKSITSDSYFSPNNTHILVYAKNKDAISKNAFRLALDMETFAFDDNDGRGKYRLEPFDAPGIRRNLCYEIENPNTHVVFVPPLGRHWRTEESNYRQFLAEGRIRFGVNGTAKPQYKAYYNEILQEGKGKAASTIWHDVSGSALWFDIDANTNATQDQIAMFGKVVFTNPKPEDLIRIILELATEENDLVLDFFLGSATTAATAHKMGRHYIGIEQMDYIQDISCERLKKVILGDQTGISKAVNWQGGGSFVYCELAQCNQRFVEAVEAATNDEEIKKILDAVLATGYISYKVRPADIQAAAEDFMALSLEDKKRFVMELLDKNMLYVNLCDLDDEEYAISDEDKAFNRSFYGLEE